MFRREECEISHNACAYIYPDGSRDLLIASEPIFRESGWEREAAAAQPQRQPRAAGKKSEGEDAKRSAMRARAKLRRLALANGFDYFVTLTLDPAKIDRYDPKAVTKALSTWCDNMVRRQGLMYILIPEQHKDGAWHFHGFMSGDGLKAVDSGIRWDGREVYNLPQWKLGHTTAQRLYGDYHAAVGSCCKYIGKQQYQRPLGRWYYSGGALAEPEKLLFDADYREMDAATEYTLPHAKLKTLHENGG